MITSARQGSTQDFEARRRHYVIAMLVRTLCFLASTILYFTHVINIWVCAIIFIAAVVLPSFAVAIANQQDTRHDDGTGFEGGAPTDAHQITTGPEPEVVSGTVEDDFGPVPDQDDQSWGEPRSRDEHPQTGHRGAA